MSDPTTLSHGTPDEPKATASSASHFWRIFTSPRSVFESLRPRPRFWLPLLVVFAAQIVMGALIVRSDAVRERTITKMEERGTPPERIEAIERALESPVVIGIQGLSSGVVQVFILVLAAALAYFVGNLLLGAQAAFAHYLCASAWSSVVGILDHVYATAQSLLKGTTSVMTGLGALVPGEPSPVVFAVDGLTDPLFLWAWFIQALGVGILTRKGLRTGILATLPAFLLAVVLRTMALSMA